MASDMTPQSEGFVQSDSGPNAPWTPGNTGSNPAFPDGIRVPTPLSGAPQVSDADLTPPSMEEVLSGAGVKQASVQDVPLNGSPKAPSHNFWKDVLQGALAGVAGGAKASMDYTQQQNENEMARQKLQAQIRFQDAESAFRAASLANQDKELHLRSIEAQDAHDKNVMEQMKYNRDNYGQQYDAIPNTGTHAMDWLQQGSVVATAAGQRGVSVPFGTLVTTSTLYVPKGVVNPELEFKKAVELSTALGQPAPTQQQFNSADVNGRRAMINTMEMRLRGLDPKTSEPYAVRELPSVITATKQNIARYEKLPNHNVQMLGVMKSSLANLEGQLKANNDNEVGVAARKASASATAEARAKIKVADEYATATTVPDPNSNSIFAATGLSAGAFAFLTGNASQLPRDAATRGRAMKEAKEWANKHNVDTSTIASQYKAANESVQKMIERQNNTRIMESELIGPDAKLEDIKAGKIGGTIGNLKDVVDAKELGDVNFNNVAKIWAGKEVNDDLAQQYATHLSQLRNELMGYFAATNGRSGNNITDADRKDAEGVIRNGIAKGGLTGLATAVYNSTTKMRPVMENSVKEAQKQVWNLFGVSKPNGKSGDNTGTKPPGW